MRRVRWNTIRIRASGCTSLAKTSPSVSRMIAMAILSPSPLTVADLAYELQDRVVRRVPQLPQQLREQAGPAADDLSQVARHLAGQHQQHVGVLAELGGELADRGLARRRHLAALDLAQIGGLDADALRHLPYREPRIVLAQRLPALADHGAERSLGRHGEWVVQTTVAAKCTC